MQTVGRLQRSHDKVRLQACGGLLELSGDDVINEASHLIFI